MRINNPTPTDAGSYSCSITNCSGATVTTASSVIQPDPAVISPPNDTCAGAIDMGETTVNFNICGAYANDGDASCVVTDELADVWYRYVPTFTGDARFQTCASSFNTTLQLSDGCAGSIAACNDDVGTRGLATPTCNTARAVISRHPVVTGVPVYVRVGALSAPFNNIATSGALTISVAPPIPANDTCEAATLVGEGTHAFDLSEATDDATYGVDICGGGSTTSSNRDVWFRLNSPCGGIYTISTCGSGMSNPMLHIVPECGQFPIACNDNGVGNPVGCTSQQARIVNYVTQGPVLIRVSAGGPGAPSGNGLGQLVIDGTPFGSADFDGDGDTGTDLDIEAFFACLGGSCCATCGSPDFDGDGDTGTDLDIESFFNVLGGGSC